MPDKVRHGWYSEEADGVGGCSYYLTDKGEKVAITLVSDSPTEHNSGWKDIQYVGVVTKHLGHSPEREAELDMLDQIWNDEMKDYYDDLHN